MTSYAQLKEQKRPQREEECAPTQYLREKQVIWDCGVVRCGDKIHRERQVLHSVDDCVQCSVASIREREGKHDILNPIFPPALLVLRFEVSVSYLGESGHHEGSPKRWNHAFTRKMLEFESVLRRGLNTKNPQRSVQLLHESRPKEQLEG